MKPNKKYVHGVVLKNDHSSHVVVNQINVETGEPSLNIIKNPQRSFWVTKKKYRNHTEKKEYCGEEELNKFTTYEHEINYDLAKALERYGNSTWFRGLCNSPYVYGADIDIRVLIKQAYKRSCPDNPEKYNVGALDIERSVLGGNEIILITYVDGYTHTAYCGIYRPFLKEIKLEDIEKKSEPTLSEFYSKLKSDVQKIIEKNPFKVVYKVLGDEEQLLTWIFNRIHDCKPNFVLIWNLDYDIPAILDRLEFLQRDPCDFFCHPEVPKHLRYVDYKRDKKKTDHITDKWHSFQCTGYTRYIDSMCLYARLRKVHGRDIKYTLDYISSKSLGTGKLTPENFNTHEARQKYDFLNYTIYNVVDSIILVLMDELHNDVSSMLGVLDTSLIDDFNNQTVQLKNTFYEFCRERKLVPSSVGNTVKKDNDDLIPNIGGGVLSPQLIKDTGVAILQESIRPTYHHKFVNDLDVKSQYPNTVITFDISRESKLSTVLYFGAEEENQKACLEIADSKKRNEALQPFGRRYEDFFSNVSAPDVNSVYLGNKYFNLPNYEQMLKKFTVTM